MNTILFIIGYIAMIYLTVFILSFLFQVDDNTTSSDDHLFLGLGSVLWPLTLLLGLAIGTIVLIVIGPGSLARRLHKFGESLRVTPRRSKENE